MPSPAALKFIAAGFLTSVLVWSLLPEASDHFMKTEWVQVPDGFSSEAAIPILQAQSEAREAEWMSAAGVTSPALDELYGSTDESR